MIAQFPKAYPDKLIYSVISRYYARSGKHQLVQVMKDIYMSKQTRPDFEFVNRYTKEAIKWITKDDDFKTIVEKHTMFPTYMRFCNKERRHNSFNALVNQSPNWSNLILIPKTGNRYIRYCPVCAKEDRDKYGETYWHREHQIRKINICAKHNCYLQDTSISLSRKSTPGLYIAESIVPIKNDIKQCKSKIEVTLAHYIVDVMNHPVNFDTATDIGIFLHSKLNKEYLNNSGMIRHFSKIYNDFKNYYGDNIFLATKDQMQKIFNGYLFDPYYICQIAMFEGIPINDFVNWSGETVENNLDDLYRLLSSKYNIEFEKVCKIGNEILKYVTNQGRVQKKSGPRQKDWLSYDKKMFPKVKKSVNSLLNSSGRPQKLSITKIQKELGLPQKQFDKLPKCKQYIQNNIEPIEMFWVKENEWAVLEIEKNGEPLNWKHIRQKTNMTSVNLRSCVERIDDIRIRTIIKNILKDIK